MTVQFKRLSLCTLLILGLTGCDKDNKVELTTDSVKDASIAAPIEVESPAPVDIKAEPEVKFETPPSKDTKAKGANTSDSKVRPSSETLAETKADASRRLEETLSEIEANMEDMDDETKAMLQEVRERAYEMINEIDSQQ